MAGARRAPGSAVKHELLAHGGNFAYFQAVRLLRRGAAPGAVLRVVPALDLAFPTRDVDRIEAIPGGHRIVARFFGLYGVASPLPTYYTEDLIEEEREDRHAARDLLDLLHEPLYALLYDAWVKPRVAQRLIEQRDADLLDRLHALIGLADPALRAALGAAGGRMLGYAGLLLARPRSALGLRGLLAHRWAPARVEVVCAVGCTAPLARDQRCRLGHPARRLGDDAVVGAKVDDASTRVRVIVSDLGGEQLQRLCPGGDDHAELQALVSHYVSAPLVVDAELVLRPGEGRGVGLGRRPWSRLGLDSWLSPQPTRAATARLSLRSGAADPGARAAAAAFGSARP